MLVAHQGGWDEFLLVAAPVAVLASLLWLANRRANRLGRDGDPAGGNPVDDTEWSERSQH
jgi:hypothetical protein